MSAKKGTTRSIHLSSSLHYDSLASFRSAGNGSPQLSGQSAQGMDNGYGLQGNPSCHELQNALSELEKGKHTLLYPSGLTALTALGGLLKAGDHWLVPDVFYGPARRYAGYLQERFGVTYDTYNPTDLATLTTNIRPQTKLIHIETPGSITFETTDLKQIVAIARQHNITTSADNTWASGILCKPLDHGVDVSILSLTKYVSGYSDVFMGSVTVSDQKLFEQFAYHHRVYGYTVSPVSAMLVQRGLETLPVRLAEHGRRAAKLIEAMRQYPQIAKIHAVDPKNSLDFSGINGLFSVELTRQYDEAELEQPLASLQTFKIGESWGGTRSLILPYQTEDFADRFNPPHGTILRFHAGLEDIDAQLADIRTLFAQI